MGVRTTGNETTRGEDEDESEISSDSVLGGDTKTISSHFYDYTSKFNYWKCFGITKGTAKGTPLGNNEDQSGENDDLRNQNDDLMNDDENDDSISFVDGKETVTVE